MNATKHKTQNTKHKQVPGSKVSNNLEREVIKKIG